MRGSKKESKNIKASTIVAGIAVAGLSLVGLTGCLSDDGYTPEQLVNPDTTELNANADAGNDDDASDNGSRDNTDASKASNENAAADEQSEGKKDDDSKRFTVTRESVNGTDISVLTDTQTGMQYLMTDNYKGMALTPLLDANGNLLVDKDATGSQSKNENKGKNATDSESETASNSSTSKNDGRKA